MKTVDKYQFNEEMFILDDGVQTHVANHTVLKRKFTLKMVNFGTSNEKEVYNYLIKEAQVLKKINTQYVYKCQKLLRSKNNFYVIYDSIEGDSLETLMKGTLLYQHRLIILKQLIEAMVDIYSVKIAYLALHPANIVIQQNYKILLKNFGHSEEFEDNTDVINLPSFQSKINPYQPPELQNGKFYRNSDFYSLGVLISTLFEKEFQSETKEDNNQKYRIRCERENINIQLTLKLLKHLSQYLAVKNIEERGNLIELLKPNPVEPLSRNTSKLQIRPTPLSPAKSISPNKSSKKQKIQFSSNRLLDEPGSPLLGKSRSIKGFQLQIQKKELNIKTVEELVSFILKKRNFSSLLIKMSELCLTNKETSITTSLVVCFLLVKKATIVISQLAKLVKQGSNNEMSINQKLKQFFQKTPAYDQLSSIINKEMATTQTNFQLLLNQVKFIPQFSKIQGLQTEVRSQKLNNNFIRRSILDFMLQLALLPTDLYAQQYKGNSLFYLYILSLLSDYQTYDDMYEQLFSQGLNGFDKQPLIEQLSNVQGKKIIEITQSNISNLFSEENYRSPLAVKTTLTAK